MMGDGIVTWCSQRQKSVALSTTEAEYIMLSQCIQDTTCMWYPILKRFEATSKALQLENIDLSNVISLYSSLKDYVEDIRNSFYTFLEEQNLLVVVRHLFGNLQEKKLDQYY